VLALLAVLSYFSSALIRYHLPNKPLFLFPDRVTEVKDYDFHHNGPFKIGPIDNFENKLRIINLKLTFTIDKVSGQQTIFDIGDGGNKFRIYIDKNQLQIIAPGGIRRDSLSQKSTLITDIKPNKKYKLAIEMKTGVFIHIAINGEQVFDMDEPGLIESGILSVGSNLDNSQMMQGTITTFKVREGIKEVRTTKIFQKLFWVALVLGIGILLTYNQAINAKIVNFFSLVPTDRIYNFLWQFSIFIIVLEFFYYVWFFSKHTYLPAPFVYAKSETFTDYFHTLYWAHREGRYEVWGTVYPPLIFLFLKWVTSNVHINDVHALRVVAYQHIYWIVGIYLLLPILVLNSRLWDGWTVKQKLLTYLGIIFSIPMLFSLERGNFIFIIPVFMAFVLSYPGMLRKLSLAILINLKPYFFIFSLGYLVKRQWKDFLISSLCTGSIFLITGFILEQHFYLFFSNLVGFSSAKDLFTGREVIGFPSSISAWPYYLRSYDWGQLQLDNGFFWTFDPLLVDSIDWIKRLILLACLVLVLLRRSVITLNEWFLFSIAFISNSGTSVSGYSLLLYYPFIPLMIKMRFGAVMIGILLMIMMPWDSIEILSHTMANVLVTFKFGFQNIDWILGAGSIVRPVLNLMLMCSIAYSITLKYKPSPTRILSI